MSLYTAAWLVLRDIWKDVIICDGKEIPIVGGFRGFRNVPPGTHTVENHGAKLEVELEPGEVKVFVLDSSENVSTVHHVVFTYFKSKIHVRYNCVCILYINNISCIWRCLKYISLRLIYNRLK